MHYYILNTNELERSFAEKDPSILLDTKLTVGHQCTLYLPLWCYAYVSSAPLETKTYDTSFPQAGVMV
ncbi:unnamed protein product, partial [Bubo scandiacus]